ncbi:MAG: hypothetical protein H0U85_01230 [Gemmatimonadales bacterium]|nr:hypothetical protein [Gemmatimonadales bacterium]
MFTRVETLRYVGRFSLVFSAVVFLLGRRYDSLGLVSIALAIAIIGLVCVSDPIRNSFAESARRVRRFSGSFRRPSGGFR